MWFHAKAFVAHHPVFFLALCIWVLVWGAATEVLSVVSFFWSPLFLGIGIVLFFLRRIPGMKPVIEIALAYPAAGVLVFLFMFGFVALPAPTTAYRLGLDVSTPAGIVSNSSLIEVVDNRTPFIQIVGGSLKIKGQAIYLDLGDGNVLVGLLTFQKDNSGTKTLSDLPRLAGIERNGPYREGGLPYDQKFSLPQKNIPILVTFSDSNDPRTMKRVTPDDFTTVFGEGYVFGRAWIQKIKSPHEKGSILQQLPWAESVQKDHGLFREIVGDTNFTSGFTPFVRHQ